MSENEYYSATDVMTGEAIPVGVSNLGSWSYTEQEALEEGIITYGGGNDASWILTLGLGSHNDLGGICAFTAAKIVEAERSRGRSLSSKTNNLQLPLFDALGDYFSRKALDTKKLQNLFGIYQEIGVWLGVPDIDGPLSPDQKQRLANNAFSPLRRGVRDKLYPLLQGIAWFSRKGMMLALDDLTKQEGANLLEYFVQDLRDKLSNGNSDIDGGVKRVNTAYAALVRVDPDCSYLTELTQNEEIKQLQSSTLGIQVAASDSSLILLGTYNPTLEVYEKASPAVRWLQGFGIGDNIVSLTRNYTCNLLKDMLGSQAT